MALADILNAIRRETEEKIERSRVLGEAEAREVMEEAGREATRVEEETGRSRDAAAVQSHARVVNKARLARDRRLRAGIEAVYQAAIERVRMRLQGIRDTTIYQEMLDRLLEEALERLPAASAVRINPADEDLLTKLLAERGEAQLRVEPVLTCWGGLELASDDGRTVRNTFESRLESAEGQLRLVATQQLGIVESSAS